MNLRFVAGMLLAGVMFLGAGVVCGQATSTGSGQAYPNKPIRVVTSDAGGGSDIVARAIAPGMASALGQPVVVDNRAGGVIAGEIVSKSPPDGHTLIYYGNTLWLLPLMRERVPYDTVKDFAPVTLAITSPNVLVVHPSLPVKSVRELIALAKARPGELNYASAASGTSNHLAAELSTIAASGLPGYESVLNAGVLAPARTPDTVINRLNQEIVRALNNTDVKEKFRNIGVEVVAGPPEQFASKIKSEIARMGRIIRDAGIRAD